MTRHLDIGFIALTDCAPLIVAEARGFFEAENLHVTLHREVSWATIRDKVAARVFDAAHMLGPTVIAASMGAGSERTPLIAPIALNANAAALAVSTRLADAMRASGADPKSPEALAHVIAARKSNGEPRLTFAVVFPYGLHNYMLRFWAASAGIDPDRDIRIVVAPPTLTVARMKDGEIDGVCVGAPWGAKCVADGVGEILLYASEFWRGAPDKVLGMNADLAEREPEVVQAVTRAVLRAALWADSEENAADLAQLLARPDYVGASQDVIATAFSAPRDRRIIFARDGTALPWRSKAMWVLSQMLRWGHLSPDANLDAGAAAYRPDLFRTAATAVGYPMPASDTKTEGANAADRIFGGAPFSPDDPLSYARAFQVTRLNQAGA